MSRVTGCLLLALLVFPPLAPAAHHKIDPIPSHLSDDALIIDVRTEDEFEDEHLAGAHHVYYKHLARRIAGIESDRDRQIVLYCTIGMRAHHAKEDLVEMGYRNVLNLGGLEDLKKRGFSTRSGSD